MLFPAAAVSEEPLRPLCFVHAAGLAKNEKNAPVLTAPKGGSPEIGRLSGEDTCTVVGEEGKYKRVIYEGETGYILSEKIRVTAREAEALPEALCSGIALADPIPPLNSLYLSLEGTLSCGRPFDTLFAYIWDERQLKVNRAYLKPLEKSAESLELSSLKSFLPIGDVPGGRKTLVLEAAYEGEMFVVFRTPLYIRGAAEDVRHITAQCTENAALLDEKISTAWVHTQRSSALPVSFPADGSAVLMTLEWKVIPDRFTVELYCGPDGIRIPLPYPKTRGGR